MVGVVDRGKCDGARWLGTEVLSPKSQSLVEDRHQESSTVGGSESLPGRLQTGARGQVRGWDCSDDPLPKGRPVYVRPTDRGTARTHYRGRGRYLVYTNRHGDGDDRGSSTVILISECRREATEGEPEGEST